MWAADHAEYLASTLWQKVRAPIIARAAGHCEECQRPTKHLQVHHLTYARSGGDELPTDLKAICRRCHLNAHNLTRKGNKRKAGQLPSLWNVPPAERRRRKKQRKAKRKKAKTRFWEGIATGKIKRPNDPKTPRRYRQQGTKYG